jgi:probable phosphoglycerate mutase
VIALVRHGQTQVNRDGRFQGRIDAPLSDVGRTQAAALAQAFEPASLQRVVSSPLSRALDTARAIAEPHGLDVVVDDRLIELDYGEWDGRSLRDVAVDDWEAWRADPEFAPPGGERLTDVTARLRSFFLECLTDQNVVAVSHVSPIKAAVCIALGVDERATWNMFLDLASITRIAARPTGAPLLSSYNETAHLA